MTSKKLSPERLARIREETEGLLDYSEELLGHIEALEDELATVTAACDQQDGQLDAMAEHQGKLSAELRAAKAEIERLHTQLDTSVDAAVAEARLAARDAEIERLKDGIRRHISTYMTDCDCSELRKVLVR